MNNAKQPVVMIFGAFDPLHPGHLSLIHQAVTLGQVIIVVVREHTIQAIKHHDPLLPEMSRLSFVQFHTGIAKVIPGYTHNFYTIIEQQQPDIILLGYDQGAYESELQSEINNRHLAITIQHATDFFPQQFNSTKIRKTLNDNTAGFLCVNKPQGWTSHDVIAKLRGQLGIKKIGHAGTLDPLATGVLIVGIGKATKLLDWWHHFPKTYVAHLEFGKISDTYDIEGVVTTQIQHNELRINTEQVHSVLTDFIGDQEQLPPAFSAKKINGKKAYELARTGQPTNLKPHHIHIYDIQLTEFKKPHACLTITCSSGTYIRSLIHDIGLQLGCGALMTKLTRTAIGPAILEQAYDLTAITPARLPEITIPVLDTNTQLLNFFSTQTRSPYNTPSD